MSVVKKTVSKKPTRAEAIPIVWPVVKSGVMKVLAVASNGKGGRKAFS